MDFESILEEKRRLHFHNLFLVANEKWCTVELYQLDFTFPVTE